MDALDLILALDQDETERKELPSGADIWTAPPSVQAINRRIFRDAWMKTRSERGITITCERPECGNIVLIHPCQVGRVFACSDYCRKEMWDRRNRAGTAEQRPVWRARKVRS